MGRAAIAGSSTGSSMDSESYRGSADDPRVPVPVKIGRRLSLPWLLAPSTWVVDEVAASCDADDDSEIGGLAAGG
jgi:hypothetical protein